MSDDAYDSRYVEGAPSNGGGGFDLGGVVLMFKRRLRSFAVAVLIVMAAVLAVGLTMKPVYKATATVVIDPRQKKVLDTDAAPGMPADTNVVDTQVQMLMSNALADRVTKLLDLDQDPEFSPTADPKNAASASKLTPDQAHEITVDAVEKHLQVRRAGLTYVINVAFKSGSGVRAAQIANAFADQFIAADLDAQSGSSLATTGDLNKQLANLQSQAEQADQAVQQYKIAHNLFSAEGSTMAEQEVSNIDQQIAEADAARAEKVAEMQAAKAQLQQGGGGADVSAALGSETIRELRSQEAGASQRLAELNAHYGPKYPDVVKAKEQLSDIHVQIQQEINRILSSLQAAVNAANGRVASLKASQGSARGSLAGNNEAQSGLLELQRRADAAQSVYQAFLNTSKQSAAVAGVAQPGAHVDTHATAPISPSAPNMRLFAAAALVLGLMAGLALALLLEHLDGGVRTGADVERRFGLPYWGGIPDVNSIAEVRTRKIGKSPQDYILTHPFSVFAEAFRNLRTFVVLKGENSVQPKVIAIASALPKEGKSTTAFCMMRTLAQAGSKVILVDCDVRRRGVSAFVEAGEAGLLEVLAGKVDVKAAVVRDGKTPAWILPVIAAPATGEDIFSGEAMTRLLATLRANFDFVILDTPPVLAVADARIIAAKTDLTVFLMRWGQTPPSAARAALDILRDTGANVGGLTLSQVDLRKQSNYAAGDGSYYYKSYRAYYANN